jgi:hypothetical protein
MASSILNSDDGVISGTSGLKSVGGDDGVLVFQSKGTETARINTDKQIVAAAGTASLPIYSTTGDTNTGIFFPAADTIAFSEGGAEAMRIDSSGNLLVGTSTTSTLSGYTVVGQFKNSIGIVSGSADEFSGALLRESSSSNSISLNADPGNLRAGSFLGFGVDGSERMRIDSSGNLLVGATTSSGRLTVATSTAVDAVIAVIAETANYASILTLNAQNNNGAIYNYIASNTSGGTEHWKISGGAVASTMAFSTGGTERARIISDGRLLVGTTTAIGGEAVTIQGRNAAGNEYCLFAQADTAATAYALRTYSTTAAAVVGSITFSGIATSYNTSSDYRLKHDIQPMTGALAKVQQLKPVTYKWNADDSDGEGFIAHELQEVAPYAVSGEKDGEEMQGVDYGKITPLLTAALQEAIAEIQSLKARVAELEAK